MTLHHKPHLSKVLAYSLRYAFAHPAGHRGYPNRYCWAAMPELAPIISCSIEWKSRSFYFRSFESKTANAININAAVRVLNVCIVSGLIEINISTFFLVREDRKKSCSTNDKTLNFLRLDNRSKDFKPTMRVFYNKRLNITYGLKTTRQPPSLGTMP